MGFGEPSCQADPLWAISSAGRGRLPLESLVAGVPAGFLGQDGPLCFSRLHGGADGTVERQFCQNVCMCRCAGGLQAKLSSQSATCLLPLPGPLLLWALEFPPTSPPTPWCLCSAPHQICSCPGLSFSPHGGSSAFSESLTSGKVNSFETQGVTRPQCKGCPPSTGVA